MSKTKRTMILIITITFLFVTVAGSIFFIIQQGQQEDSLEEASTQQGAQEQAANELEQGENMLQGTKLQGFEPVSSADELQVIDLEEGNGKEATKGSTITAHYTGAYATTGEIFESSLDRGAPFTAGLVTPEESSDGRGLIEGWVEGIPGMKPGGKRRLIIPGELAYGEAPEGFVPGTTQQPLGPLVFDIELVSVEE